MTPSTGGIAASFFKAASNVTRSLRRKATVASTYSFHADVSPAGGSVQLAVRAAAHGVLLEVTDSGPGIRAGERDKVFTPFYRAAATMEANPAGTGLGLAIVRDIAPLHGAQVTLAEGDGGRGLKVGVLFAT